MRFPTACLLLVCLSSTACAQKKLAAVEWSTGNCKVTLPNNPKVENQEFAVGKVTLKVQTSKCEIDSNLYVSVSFADYPPEFKNVLAKTLLDSIRDGLKEPDGKIEMDQEISLGEKKIPGREFKIEAGKKVIRARVYIVGQRVYQVLAVGSKEGVAKSLVDEMFKSFQIIE